MTTTPHLNLPMMLASQADKHVVFNEAMIQLDALIHVHWLDILDAPPANPEQGDGFLVGTTPTGTFVGKAGYLATWRGDGWDFARPQKGWLGWSAVEGALFVYSGTAWSGVTRPNTLGINTTANDIDRLSVRSASVIFCAETGAGASGDVHMKLNKEGLNNSACISFQASWQDRFDIGLINGDDLSIRFSAADSTWNDAVKISYSSGKIGIGIEPGTASLTLPGYSAICGVGTQYATSLDLDGGALVIRSSQTSQAAFRLLPFSSDIYFQNTNSDGSIYFTGNSGAALAGNVTFQTTVNVAMGAIVPTCKLHVDGPIRCRSYVVATLPDAEIVGAGGMVYVTNDVGGSTLAFSDGVVWRRTTDREVVAST
jgi:hypothetical protein